MTWHFGVSRVVPATVMRGNTDWLSKHHPRTPENPRDCFRGSVRSTFLSYTTIIWAFLKAHSPRTTEFFQRLHTHAITLTVNRIRML